MKHTVYVFGKREPALPCFCVRICRAKRPFFKRNTRYDNGFRTERRKFAQNFFDIFAVVAVGAVFGVRKQARFGQIGSEYLRAAAKRFHFFGECGEKRRVKPPVVTHNRVGEDKRVAVRKRVDNAAYHVRLRFRAEEARIECVNFQTETFPMVDYLRNFVGQVKVCIAVKAARVRGQKRGGKHRNFNARRRQHGQGDRQRTFADAGYVMNGNNSFLHNNSLYIWI